MIGLSNVSYDMVPSEIWTLSFFIDLVLAVFTGILISLAIILFSHIWKNTKDEYMKQ